MIVITAHNVLDFDALACMVAARRLYPQAQIAFSGLIAKSAQEFVSLNKELLDIKDIRQMDAERIRQLVVVDTANPKRLTGFEKVLQKPELSLHVYDHHPPAADDLSGDFRQVEPLGAASTMLVEKIREQEIGLDEFEATTIALGIYSDTGGLLYDSTTARDVEAVGWLLKQGANLEVIRENMEQRLSPEQMEVFQQGLKNMQQHTVAGVDILLCKASLAHRVPGLDVVTMRLFAVEGAEAVFTLTEDPKSVEIIGRSSSPYVDVSRILKPLGGRGHIKAASATLKKKSLLEAEQLLLESIEQNVQPSRCARDIMSSPVKTLLPDTSLEEADKVLLRYGHTGMPILREGKLIGMISRRDVDKARMHNLEHAPVKGFMNTNVITASPDTPLDHLQDLMVSHDVGRLPIVDGGTLVGIVSRTDILREIYHSRKEPSGSRPPGQEKKSSLHEQAWNYARKMEQNLPEELLQILKSAGNIASENEWKVYVVGGFVRDLLMNVSNQDIDFVVEGDSHAFAEKLARDLGGQMHYHDRFQTANVTLPGRLSLDVAAARAEYYEYPAALPQVERSSIREDMYRRDFSINAMAVCLNPEHFGDLIDFFGGRRDLENRLIRVLYHFSFIEDPTRIVRAVRFAQRYQFQIEEDTLRMAKDALGRGMVSRLSQDRLWHEILLILEEKHPAPALKLLRELQLLSESNPELGDLPIDEEAFHWEHDVIRWWKEHMQLPLERKNLHIHIFLMGLPAALRRPIAERMNLKQRMIQEVESLEEILAWMQTVDWQQIRFSEIDRTMHDLSTEAFLYCAVKSRMHVKDTLFEYLLCRKNCKVSSDGNRLKELGFTPGPAFSRMLTRLYHLRLDGVIGSREEEEYYLEQWKKGEPIL